MNYCIPKFRQKKNEPVEYKIIKTKENKHIVYVLTMDHYRILCISSNMATCEAMLEKYNKDPGGFSFRHYI